MKRTNNTQTQVNDLVVDHIPAGTFFSTGVLPRSPYWRTRKDALGSLNGRFIAGGIPCGEYHVDADALRRARQGTPSGEYHVDADALRRARQGTPSGEYHVDADALRRARQGTPSGEYHNGAVDMSQHSMHSSLLPYPSSGLRVRCGGRHPFEEWAIPEPPGNIY